MRLAQLFAYGVPKSPRRQRAPDLSRAVQDALRAEVQIPFKALGFSTSARRVFMIGARMVLLALALLAAPPPSLPRGRLAFIISGGVSLGSYEAGLTWAIVRYLRASGGTDLAAVTGASAGGINALMAAA